MFDDPAFPSLPPPPDDEAIKPMSGVGGAMWAVGAQIMFLWMVTLAAALKGGDAERGSYDLIGLVLCQVVAYLLVLYLVLRVYAPNTAIRGLVALRRSNPWFLLLGLVIGVAATYPSYWVLEQIDRVYPRGDDLFDWLDAFYALSLPERIAVGIGTVLVGPFMEEMLFRGALYRPLRVDKSAPVVVALTAFLFAAAHLDLQKMPPLFLMGLALGYLRWASGSMLPPFLLHVGFNAVPVMEMLQHTDKSTLDAEPLPISWVTGGAGVMVLALLFTHALAKSSRRASAARREDA